MKLRISVGKCVYCAKQVVLINDYMADGHPCPGHIVQCREYKCEIPEDILRREDSSARG